jgi:hypothetical protein
MSLARLNPLCEANITDECVACTQGISNGNSCVGMDEAALVPCLSSCLHMVPPPATADECKELTAAGTTVPAAIESGNCMCDNCFDIYAPCITNTACLRVMLCVAEQGCIGLACTADPICMPIIGEAVGADPSLAEALTSTLAACSGEHACQGQTADGGQDAGAADGG